MTNHNQLPDGIIIPPMPTEFPTNELPFDSESIRGLYDGDIYRITDPSTKPSQAIVSTEAIPTTELPLSTEPVDRSVHETSKLAGKNIRQRLTDTESTAARTRELFRASHGKITEKTGEETALSEIRLEDDIHQIEVIRASINAYYDQRVARLRQEASVRRDERRDAIEAVNASNEVALRGFERSGTNINTYATSIRNTLTQQETLRDRAKEAIDEWSKELNDKQRNLDDETRKVAQLEEALANLNTIRRQLIDSGNDLVTSENNERSHLLRAAVESEAFKEALNGIENLNVSNDEKTKMDEELTRKTAKDVSSAELTIILKDLKLNDEAKESNANDITHHKGLIAMHAEIVAKLDARVKELPRLILSEKAKYGDAIDYIDQISDGSLVLQRTAEVFEAARLHPEISSEELLKLTASEGLPTDKEAEQQILAALRPALAGGSALVEALNGDRGVALRHAQTILDFEPESAPVISGPMGEIIPTPDIDNLSANLDSSTRRNEAASKKIGHKVLEAFRGLFGSKAPAYQFDERTDDVKSLTAAHED